VCRYGEAYDACAAAETNQEQRARALAGAGVARANLGELPAAAANLEAAIDLRSGDGTGLSLAHNLPLSTSHKPHLNCLNLFTTTSDHVNCRS
jgi:hypothetical protein